MLVREHARSALVTVRALAQIEGVGGFHPMGFRNESVLAEIIAGSGLRNGARASATGTNG